MKKTALNALDKECFDRFRKYVTVRTRKKRMVKKVTRWLCRYLTDAGTAKCTAFLVNRYLRLQVNESSFARMLFPTTENGTIDLSYGIAKSSVNASDLKEDSK